MNDTEAARILSEHKVDRSFDPRPASEVLKSMVDRGYLPGQLLDSQIELVMVNTEDNQKTRV